MISSVCFCVSAGDAHAAEQTERCGPKYVHVEPDTGSLLILCEKSDSILRLNPQTGEVEKEAAVGEEPFALTPHPDGKRLYVSCRRGQEILEIDASTLTTLRRFELRGDPTGVAVSRDGKRLFVGVHSLDQVAVFDLDSGVEIQRLAAGNGPEYLRLAPRQGRIYVTNILTNLVPPDVPCQTELTVIDDESGTVVDRILLENASALRRIDFNSDETLGIVALTRPKNLVPMVQVARGWVITNGFAVLSPDDDPPMQLLIDLPNQAYADAYGVVFTPDDKKIYLSAAASDSVIVMDVSRLRGVMRDVRRGVLPRPSDHLGLSRRYVTARIPVGACPEALAVDPSGQWVYCCNRLDDSLSVIDTSVDAVTRTIVIKGPSPPDRLLRGERFFHSAARTFHGQFTCTGCHPDSGFDALQYDLEPDGLGENIVDNRNLRDVVDTGPFKWIGSNPDISTQCGTRTAKWITRTGWLTSTEVVDLATYINALKPVHNPYRQPDRELTDAQRRGKELFDRTVDNQGDPIPERDRCNFCHAGAKFTDSRKSDVGTKGPRDRKAKLDTAHLNNIFESAPYLHDGRAATLEEIWTKYNPDDKHGLSSDWNKRQLNDIVEYLKSL